MRSRISTQSTGWVRQGHLLLCPAVHAGEQRPGTAGVSPHERGEEHPATRSDLRWSWPRISCIVAMVDTL